MSQETRGKIGRNDPCWCKSGIKFKNCHLHREEQTRAPYHEFANHLKKTREGQLECLYPVGTGTCSGTVIKAHSISRSAALSPISRNNQVYQPNIDPFAIVRSDGEIEHHLVYIATATTFTGFCGLHDAQLFRPIDTSSLKPTREQAFLFHYRAICRELYVKRPTLESTSQLREADRGRSVKFQERLQKLVAVGQMAISNSISELEGEKKICDAAIQAGTLPDIHGLVFHFDDLPTIACSGLTQPVFDFRGNEIQNLADMTIPMQRMSFTLLPSDSGGIGVLAWLASSDQVCRRFANSLLNVSDEAKCSAIVQWVFDSFENHALQPEWWEGLNEPMRKELQLIGHNWANPFILDSGSLVPTQRRFADWNYKSFEWL
jgi:hypothetical protein